MTQRKNTATLKILAQRLRLHESTVSRVLNSTDSEARAAAGPETVARIRKAAAELNYSPNPHALGLKTRKTRTIGVLVPRLSDLVIATIYEGIDEAAGENRYSSFVSMTGDSPIRQRQLGEMILNRGVEGIIVADARLDNRQFIDEIAASGIPLMLVSRRLDGHCSVSCDDYRGGFLAAEHLLQRGHRSFGVLGGAAYASPGVDRTAGFVTHCRNSGIAIAPANVVTNNIDTRSGYDGMKNLLKASELPTAVFAANDFLAIGAMGAVRDHGLRPGVDVAIVGFNDVPISAHLPVGLTTIRSPMHTMGRRSVELLLQQIDGGPRSSELLAPELVVRASSNVARVPPK